MTGIFPDIDDLDGVLAAIDGREEFVGHGYNKPRGPRMTPLVLGRNVRWSSKMDATKMSAPIEAGSRNV